MLDSNIADIQSLHLAVHFLGETKLGYFFWDTFIGAIFLGHFFGTFFGTLSSHLYLFEKKLNLAVVELLNFHIRSGGLTKTPNYSYEKWNYAKHLEMGGCTNYQVLV